MRGTRYEVLRNIAKHAKPDGRHSYPGIETLAELSHCDEGSVRRATKWLYDHGFIDASWRRGSGQHSSFDVIMSYAEIDRRRLERLGAPDAQCDDDPEPAADHPVTLASAHDVPNAHGRGSWDRPSVPDHLDRSETASEPDTATVEETGQSARYQPVDNPPDTAQNARCDPVDNPSDTAQDARYSDGKYRANTARKARENRASGAPYKEEPELEPELPPTPFAGSPHAGSVDPHPGPGAGPEPPPGHPPVSTLVAAACVRLATQDLADELGRHPGSVRNHDGWIRGRADAIAEAHGQELAAVAETRAAYVHGDPDRLAAEWVYHQRATAAAAAEQLAAEIAAADGSVADLTDQIQARWPDDPWVLQAAFDAWSALGSAPPAPNPIAAKAAAIAQRHTEASRD
ncbi:MAG: hypothetical protein ACXIVQ_12090 [Acidimicrobiales bacterium]